MTLKHLDEATAAMANESSESRISIAGSRLWVPTPMTSRILKHLDKLTSLPKGALSGSLLIVGPSGAGKTSLRNRFLEKYPEIEAGEVSKKIVVSVETPSVPEVGALCSRIVLALGESRPQGTIDDRLRRILFLLKLQETKLLCFDEVQHGNHLGDQTKRHFMNLLKSIDNESDVRIIAFGTPEALKLFSVDPQLRRRYDYEFLSDWPYDAAFLRLLASWERRLPLRAPSNLASKDLSKAIHSKTLGNMAKLAVCLGKAAVAAIEDGTERITAELVKAVEIRTVGDECLRT